MNDTICAVSTALGIGAISIIRVSGIDAIKIVNNLFKGKDLTKVASHTINYGKICYQNKTIDEVLVSIMKSPKTYTTEDIVEINCHGGITTTNKILTLLLENGCRLAEPGEFTKRAFLNGRIDLLEAEAVQDLLVSESDSAREMSLNQIEGKLSNQIKQIRKEILNLMANIEVNLDYPEYEDAPEVTHNLLTSKIEVILTKLNNLLNNAENGRIIKNGINVAIVGRPNVGKSSILNYLLNEEKAIVTEIPGTTRDIIEGSFLIDGIKFNLIDTAGIRNTKNKVEKIGVNKSKKAINEADLVILVLNNNQKLTKEDENLLKEVKNHNYIIFINKNDLKNNLKLDDQNVIYGNTLDNDGLNDLITAIKTKFNLEQIKGKDLTYLSNARQVSLVKLAIESLENVIKCAQNDMSIDFLAQDIKTSWNYLGEIIGEVYQDELLDELFSNFCLGK